MEATKRNILQLSASQAGVSSQQIAERLEISQAEACFYLDDLERGGFIKLVRLQSLSGDESYLAMSVTPRGAMVLEGKLSLEDRIDSKQHSQNFKVVNNAPIASQQLGNNNMANVKQNVGTEVTEILQLIDSLRQLVDTLPVAHHAEALEALDDIQEELTVPTRASRIKGGLLTLWSFAKDIASFANAVTALEQRFHLDHLLS